MAALPSIGQIAPPSKFQTLTKSNATVYLPPLRMIYVGGTGDVAVMGEDDTVAVVFVGVPVGTVLVGLFKQVMSTGTTATNLIGGY
jgi:hypothetical protein